MRTENWRSNTRGLRLVGEDESGSASSDSKAAQQNP